MCPVFGDGGGGSLPGRALWEWPQGQGQLALSAHPPSLPDGAGASHPCAWPLDTSLQPKGCPFSPHHCRCACTCSSHKPSPWWQDGDGDGGGEHPQSPSLEGKRRVVGEVKSLPVKLARCLPPPALLLSAGMAVPAQNISEGAGCPWEGAGGAAVPSSPCTQAGKCKQGPGVAGMCSLGTHGEWISPTAPWGVPGRSRQGGEGDGSSQGISGCRALPGSCGITGDVHTARLRAAAGAQSEWGKASPSIKSSWIFGTKMLLDCLHKLVQAKARAQPPSLPWQPDPLRSHPPGGYADPWDVPAAGRGCTGYPRASRAWLAPGRAAELAVRHVGPGQASPAAGRSVPAWPGPSALRRPPRPGASQVLERSWERIPWLRCGSAHALGDLGPATAKD